MVVEAGVEAAVTDLIYGPNGEFEYAFVTSSSGEVKMCDKNDPLERQALRTVANRIFNVHPEQLSGTLDIQSTMKSSIREAAEGNPNAVLVFKS